MELLYPMVISAVAVLVTLIYASYLDIRDRRVPFIHWLPMLAVGICCTSYLLWQTTTNISLIFGYLSLVACFLYADYLDNRGWTGSLGLTFYYRKASIFYYLALVLILPALSWFVLAPPLNFQLVPWYGMYAGIIGYVSYMEYTGKFEDNPKTKRKKQDTSMAEAINRWYFVLVVISLVIASVYMITSGTWRLNDSLFIILPAVFAIVFYIFGRMHLFGGADAWALIFISFCIPTFPFTPLLGNTPLGFLAFSVLINALLLNLVAPLGIFAINIMRGNRAPLMYMFFGFPVPGETIQQEWGFVMEEFEEKKGVQNRKFIGFWDSIRRMYSGEGRVYTKDLREHPEKFTSELASYRKAGSVWISYAVPFIIPITAGLITAIIFGDFLLAIMHVLVGA
jgi:preflagellin peptidase FlaK